MEVEIKNIEKNISQELDIKGNTSLQNVFSNIDMEAVLLQQKDFRIIEKQIDLENNYYKAYILSKYPIGATMKAFLKQISKNDGLYSTFEESETFKELKQKVKEYEEMESINK